MRKTFLILIVVATSIFATKKDVRKSGRLQRSFTAEIPCETRSYTQNPDGSLDSNHFVLENPMVGTFYISLNGLDSANSKNFHGAAATMAIYTEFSGLTTPSSFSNDLNFLGGLSFTNCAGVGCEDLSGDVYADNPRWTWNVMMKKTSRGKYYFKRVIRSEKYFNEVIGSIDCHMENKNIPIDFNITVRNGNDDSAEVNIIRFSSIHSPWAKKVIKQLSPIDFGETNYSNRNCSDY